MARGPALKDTVIPRPLEDQTPPLPIITASHKKLAHKHSTEMLQLGASVHRGLENKTGENNCFLNVIIQSFWHLRSMRRLLLKLNVDCKDSHVAVMVALHVRLLCLGV